MVALNPNPHDGVPARSAVHVAPGIQFTVSHDTPLRTASRPYGLTPKRTTSPPAAGPGTAMLMLAAVGAIIEPLGVHGETTQDVPSDT